MTYRLIHKDSKNQPARGTYTDWKVQISEECYKQCVYCTINESHWGGIDHYHIDHYRPVSIEAFKKLENDICNLFYACPVCNRFKSNDWPADPDLAIPSYPDPSVTDYSTILEFDTYTIVGKNPSANYIIERLYLNRPQLIYERRECALMEKEKQLFDEIVKLAPNVENHDLVKRSFELMGAIRTHLAARENIRPYKLSEIRKP